MLKKIENGDLVRLIYYSNTKGNKCGIVVSSLRSNNYPSKHAENVMESYPLHHYVLFDKFIEGPFLTSELTKVD